MDFSCSNLGDQKISILAEILQVSTLTHIYLGENDIGIKAIIEASKFNNNNNIVHLDLHNNNISNEEVKLIAEFLTNNKTLKHLDISGNKITLEVVKAIIEALRENTTITHIDLEQDNIDNKSKVIIEKYLQRNKNLMSFQKLADGINDKVDTNIAINAKDKAIIKDTIEEIIHKAKELNNTTDIDKITASMQGLIVDKSTKLKIMTIENQLNEIIDSQNINNDDVSMLGGDFVPAAG
ncbi:leucine Rich repeat family protein [Rickettsia hoogstraalii str. RCCE3]|nr:leucine Rich repeat family protein [Rickettsia hoogstraalii str. RCCE3]